MEQKVYDLEERTYLFAKAVRVFVKKLDVTLTNQDDIKQVSRSSGSIAANYIEVNDNLGPKDLLMRLRTCKKEAKETILWLKLLEVRPLLENERQELLREATEIKNILGSIYKKKTEAANKTQLPV